MPAEDFAPKAGGGAVHLIKDKTLKKLLVEVLMDDEQFECVRTATTRTYRLRDSILGGGIGDTGYITLKVWDSNATVVYNHLWFENGRLIDEEFDTSSGVPADENWTPCLGVMDFTLGSAISFDIGPV